MVRLDPYPRPGLPGCAVLLTRSRLQDRVACDLLLIQCLAAAGYEVEFQSL